MTKQVDELIRIDIATDLFDKFLIHDDYKVTVENMSGEIKDTFALKKGCEYDYLRDSIARFYKERGKKNQVALKDKTLDDLEKHYLETHGIKE